MTQHTVSVVVLRYITNECAIASEMSAVVLCAEHHKRVLWCCVQSITNECCGVVCRTSQMSVVERQTVVTPRTVHCAENTINILIIIV